MTGGCKIKPVAMLKSTQTTIKMFYVERKRGNVMYKSESSLKRIAKERLTEIVYTLIRSGISKHDELNNNYSFELGQISAYLDIINYNKLEGFKVTFSTQPSLSFYRDGNLIAVEEI